MQILTHRGLLPSRPDFFSESSIQSFSHHLSLGFGLEVDVNFTKDGIVFCHDATLARMTEGKDQRALKDLTTQEACSIPLKNGRLGSFEELMEKVKPYPKPLIALHFKGAFQNQKNAHTLLEYIHFFHDLLPQLLVFDVTLTTARLLKEACPALSLAASVAHPFDITRYQAATMGTLLSMEDFLAHRALFNWAWLDEWDLANLENGKINPRGKRLYTAQTFQRLRDQAVRIALVTPELHASSPSLLGGESHPDAQGKSRLFERISEILALKPDAICTDYPIEVMQLASQ